MSSLFNDNKRVGKNQYKISKFPQRRNIVYKQRISGVICKFCEEKQKSSKGRKKKWRSLNSLHGHCSFDHRNEDYKDYLINLAEKIIRGVLV